MFPSPYGVIYLITNHDHVLRLELELFPSPYGVIYLITKGIKTKQGTPVSFRPLTGLSISLPISLKGQYLCGISRLLCFALKRLSPILNHAACAHLHLLIIISNAIYHVRRYALLGIPILPIPLRESYPYNR